MRRPRSPGSVRHPTACFSSGVRERGRGGVVELTCLGLCLLRDRELGAAERRQTRAETRDATERARDRSREARYLCGRGELFERGRVVAPGETAHEERDEEREPAGDAQ